MTATIHHGDCLDVLRNMPDNSVHAIVTDPPYGLANTTPEQVADTIVRWVNGERDYLPAGKGFMGKSWDAFVPPVAVWDEAMRVLKPGGHVLAFAGTRTMDLMTLGLRLAGFDIRDSVAWLYGSGFPKSKDIGKSIDRAAGVDLEVIGVDHERQRRNPNGKGGTMRLNGFTTIEEAEDAASRGEKTPNGRDAAAVVANYYASAERLATLTAPATDAAKQWHGWGSAAKPAFEPVVMARKPFRGTLAANVLEHGTGGLNIDACRIGTEPGDDLHRARIGGFSDSAIYGTSKGYGMQQAPSGRWPANVILDEHCAGVLDQMTGTLKSGWADSDTAPSVGAVYGNDKRDRTGPHYSDAGGASRFFYVAKASKRERPDVDGIKHPTVKPLALMQWLVRLVTPPNGIVLDPFAGSGTTIEAAMLEGFQVIGIEREAEYLPLIRHRIDRATEQLKTEQEQQAEAPDQGAFPLEEIA